MEWIYDDGGREASFRGSCGDCVVRAIAIAAELDYESVYFAMAEINAEYRGRGAQGKRTARSGVFTRSAGFKRYMAGIGWKYTPTMGIGTGCKVHLVAEELPRGRLIVQVSKHLCAVIDGVIHDTFNPSERGTTIYSPNTLENIPAGARLLENGNGWVYKPLRCVYGYWQKAV